MTRRVTHSTVTGASADPTALVDGVAWDADHTLTGVETPSQGGTGVVNNDASTITITGSFGLTFTISAATSITLPTTGTLATLAGVETFSNKSFSTAVVIESTSSSTLVVGPNGATNPTFKVDGSVASQATGVRIAGAAAGGGAGIIAISSGTDEVLGVNAKGAAAVYVGSTSTGGVNLGSAGGGVTISSALTYGSVALANTFTGSASSSLVGSISPTFTGTVTLATLAATTINGFTLAGPIAGGGNQLNNIIIGTSTPLAVTGTAITGNSFVPNLSTVPTNGMYLPAANTLGWAINSAAEVQLTSTAFFPAVDGGSSLGTATNGWQNLQVNTGFILNIDNTDWLATHTTGVLTVGTGDLRVTNAGANTASVVTVGGAQTLANKSLTAPALGTPVSGVLTNVTGYTIANLADSAYTAWVPTVTAQVGTITTLGTVTARYKQVGKTILFYINIPITTNGTGAGYVQATLPTASANTANQSAVGRENGLTGKNLGARIVVNSTSLQFTFYDGTYPGADGAALGASGFYEVP